MLQGETRSGAYLSRSVQVGRPAAPGHPEGHKGPAPKPRPPPEPSSMMLPTLLVSCILTLLWASPGQTQVPIQANFDASQVCPGVPLLLTDALSIQGPSCLLLRMASGPGAAQRLPQLL